MATTKHKPVLLIAVRGGKRYGVGSIRRTGVLVPLFERYFTVRYWAPSVDRCARQFPRRAVAGATLRTAVRRCHAAAVLCDMFQNAPPGALAHDPGVFLGALDEPAGAHTDLVVNLRPMAASHTAKKNRTVCYEGYEYAIIRDEFFQARRLNRLRDVPRTIYIWFGGWSDPPHWTLRTVQFLKKRLSKIQKVAVVVSPLNRDRALIEKTVRGDRRFQVMDMQPDIYRVMARADLAITTGGGTLIELAFLGVPALVKAGELWEKKFLGDLSRIGFARAFPVGKIKSCETAWRASEDVFWRKQARMAGRRMFDGRGKQRIVRAFMREFRHWQRRQS